jgi:hypothetical protein
MSRGVKILLRVIVVLACGGVFALVSWTFLIWQGLELTYPEIWVGFCSLFGMAVGLNYISPWIK